MICKHCFRMSDDGLSYCPYCGYSFADNAPEEPKKPDDPANANANANDNAGANAGANPNNAGANANYGANPNANYGANPNANYGANPNGAPRNDAPPYTQGGGASYRQDSVPQGQQYYGGYPPYGQYPPIYMLRPEKTPGQKLRAGIGHALLYILLFFFCQMVVTFVYMMANMVGVSAEITNKYASDPFYSTIPQSQLESLIQRDLEEAMDEFTSSIPALHYNLISIVSGALTIAALLIIASVKHRPFSEHVGFYPIRTPKVLLMLPIGIAMQFLSVEVINLIPWPAWAVNDLNNTYSYLGQEQSIGGFIVELLAVVVAGPLVEELIFRGCVYTRLRRGMPVAAAVILSAFAFGLMHGSLIAVCYASTLGLLLAYMYVKFESVIAPFLLHLGFNLANYIPLLRENSSTVEVILTFAISAVVFVVCFSVILLSDVSRKKHKPSGGDDGFVPPAM